MEASLKAQTILMHPLIIEQNQKVLQQTKRKFPDRVTNSKEGGKKVKSDNIKEKRSRKKSSGVLHYHIHEQNKK
jgi:hypothetical protein